MCSLRAFPLSSRRFPTPIIKPLPQPPSLTLSNTLALLVPLPRRRFAARLQKFSKVSSTAHVYGKLSEMAGFLRISTGPAHPSLIAVLQEIWSPRRRMPQVLSRAVIAIPCSCCRSADIAVSARTKSEGGGGRAWRRAGGRAGTCCVCECARAAQDAHVVPISAHNVQRARGGIV